MEPDGQRQRSAEQATREELYAEIDRGSRIDGAFLQLVVLSTTIAAIGLRENSVAIIIAAMMIGRGSVAAACRYSWAYDWRRATPVGRWRGRLTGGQHRVRQFVRSNVFLLKGINPLTWLDRRAANRSSKISLGGLHSPRRPRWYSCIGSNGDETLMRTADGYCLNGRLRVVRDDARRSAYSHFRVEVIQQHPGARSTVGSALHNVHDLRH